MALKKGDKVKILDNSACCPKRVWEIGLIGVVTSVSKYQNYTKAWVHIKVDGEDYENIFSDGKLQKVNYIENIN